MGLREALSTRKYLKLDGDSQFPLQKPRAMQIVTGLLPALCRTDGPEQQSPGMNRLLVCWGTENPTSLLFWSTEQSAFYQTNTWSDKDEESSLPLPLAIGDAVLPPNTPVTSCTSP